MKHLFWAKLLRIFIFYASQNKENSRDIFMQQEMDGIQFEMKEAFDFGFLRRYGTVFQVFDDQDSGNICFGMEKNNG